MKFLLDFNRKKKTTTNIIMKYKNQKCFYIFPKNCLSFCCHLFYDVILSIESTLSSVLVKLVLNRFVFSADSLYYSCGLSDWLTALLLGSALHPAPVPSQKITANSSWKSACLGIIELRTIQSDKKIGAKR